MIIRDPDETSYEDQIVDLKRQRKVCQIAIHGLDPNARRDLYLLQEARDRSAEITRNIHLIETFMQEER